MSIYQDIVKNLFKAQVKADEFESVYSIFQRSSENRWILGKNDAEALYNLVKEFKPRNVLELGGGIGASTAVIASALEEGQLITIEQFEKCTKIAKELLPEKLKNKIKFFISTPYAFQVEKISKYIYFSGYKNLPFESGPFDFLVIDGPAPWLEGEELIHLPNGDLINLLPHLKVGAKIFIDRRKDAISLYKRFLSLYLKIIEDNKRYTIFERTEKELPGPSSLEIMDLELISLKSRE